MIAVSSVFQSSSEIFLLSQIPWWRNAMKVAATLFVQRTFSLLSGENNAVLVVGWLQIGVSRRKRRGAITSMCDWQSLSAASENHELRSFDI